MRYYDFLDEYCRQLEQNGIEKWRAAWVCASPLGALFSEKYIDIFITKDNGFEDYTAWEEFTILRDLCLEDSISAENELNKLLGLKQYD